MVDLRHNFGEGLIVGSSITSAVVVATQGNDLRLVQLVGGIAGIIAGLILVYGGRTP